ncbi:MAG: ABC transporter permease [Acidimicrobiales bacterium]
MRALRGRWVVVVSLGVLALAVAAAVLAPLITWHDPVVTDVRARLQPPVWMDGGTLSHPLGTDSVGRDLFTRIVFGLRASLFIGFAAVAVGGIVGVTAGVLAGYYDGRIGAFAFGRLADVQQAIPFVVLGVAIAAAIGPSFRNLILILGLGSWLFYYRVVRSEVLAIREEPFILAARTIGSSDRRILVRHALPNVLPSILVTITLFVPSMIMFAAALSFLGLGVQAPQPELGLMISEGRGFIDSAWWLSVFPGLALAVIVLAMNSLGDWLRDYLDPTQRRGRAA